MYIYIFLSLKRRKTRILFNASITLDFALNYANYHAQKLCSGLSKIDAKNHWIYNLPWMLSSQRVISSKVRIIVRFCTKGTHGCDASGFIWAHRLRWWYYNSAAIRDELESHSERRRGKNCADCRFYFIFLSCFQSLTSGFITKRCGLLSILWLGKFHNFTLKHLHFFTPI